MKEKITEPLPDLAARMAFGKKQRLITPLKWHAEITKQGHKRADPVQLLITSNEDRLQELVPIRYARMLQSSFAFFRGAAIVMAEDLAHPPNSGITVQLCGDCHLMNFGGYATPERNQVFDINDFDETLPGPFEWDIKRLAASIIIAGRSKGFSNQINKKAVLEMVKIYTLKMRKYAHMRQLEIWYSALNLNSILKLFKTERKFNARLKVAAKKARHRTHEYVFPKLSVVKDGQRKIIDEPPLLYHLPESNKLVAQVQAFFENYYESLTADKKELLKRFRLVDAAIKVVGVGSVGTRCYIALFMANEDDAIILQFKEANSSVLEQHITKTAYKNYGERIVNGQRLMQTVSDIFLGWARDNEGRDFYVRQLRDMKTQANLDNFDQGIFYNYTKLCGWALAKSHARSNRAPEITGYLGKSNKFSAAIVAYAMSYADQNEKDYQLLKEANLKTSS